MVDCHISPTSESAFVCQFKYRHASSLIETSHFSKSTLIHASVAGLDNRCNTDFLLAQCLPYFLHSLIKPYQVQVTRSKSVLSRAAQRCHSFYKP